MAAPSVFERLAGDQWGQVHPACKYHGFERTSNRNYPPLDALAFKVALLKHYSVERLEALLIEPSPWLALLKVESHG